MNMNLFVPKYQAGNTTTIRRTAVRETCVSQHRGDLIEGPPDTSRTSQHYGINVFVDDSQLALDYAERS